jgi:hypothetical protein
MRIFKYRGSQAKKEMWLLSNYPRKKHNQQIQRTTGAACSLLIQRSSSPVAADRHVRSKLKMKQFLIYAIILLRGLLR